MTDELSKSSPTISIKWTQLISPFRISRLHTQASTSMAAPHLLSLPGELRNQIYAYCYETAPPTEGQFDFLSLTQTCQQLRAEFRPLHMIENRLSIPFSRTAQYLAAFIPQPGPNSLANFMVSLPLYMECKADLIPLVHVSLLAPRAKYKWQMTERRTRTTPANGIPVIVSVLDVCYNFIRTLASGLDCVAKLEMRLPHAVKLGDGKVQEFHITFKQGVREEWMDGRARSVQDTKIMMWLGSSRLLALSDVGMRVKGFLDAVEGTGPQPHWNVTCYCE